MTLDDIGGQFPTVAECIAGFCGGADALCLSRADASWSATLSRPVVWRSYLFGPSQGLVRPILADKGVAALFGSDLVHRRNHRAAVAFLASSRWWSSFTTMKRALIAGRLREPLRSRCRAKRAKLDILKSMKQVTQQHKQFAKPCKTKALASVVRLRASVPLPAPSTPTRTLRNRFDRSMSPPRPARHMQGAAAASQATKGTPKRTAREHSGRPLSPKLASVPFLRAVVTSLGQPAAVACSSSSSTSSSSSSSSSSTESLARAPCAATQTGGHILTSSSTHVSVAQKSESDIVHLGSPPPGPVLKKWERAMYPYNVSSGEVARKKKIRIICA